MMTKEAVRFSVVMAASVVAVGCGSRPPVNDPDEGGIDDSGIGTGQAGQDDTGSADDGDADSADSSKMPRLDVGGGSADDGVSMDGCTKIDFLFVIDSSGSMEGEQTNLINSFPGFIDAILEKTEARDFHILVTDTDDVPNGQICQALCSTGFIPDCMGVPCSEIPPAGGGSACDMTLGSGHVDDQNGLACNIDGPQRFLLENQSNLQDTFACIARVGVLGSGDEQQAGATVGAVSAALNGPGGCNEGFVRDDAILVITIISDEEDGPNDGEDEDTNSPGEPAAWKKAIMDAKLGNEDAIVVLGLVGDSDAAGGACNPLDTESNVGAEGAVNLRSFIESFVNSSWGSVCSDNYAPFFAEAISIIDTVCEGFEPPG